MDGYQFAHMEVWPLAPSRPKSDDGKARRRNGEKKWSASEVIDELERVQHASEHVIKGRPGPEIIGGEADNFTDLRKLHLKSADFIERYSTTGKHGIVVERSRRLRKDAASLYVSVLSLPVRTADALADAEIEKRARKVLQNGFEHERSRIEQAGGTVLAGVIHWDEEFLHIHVAAIDQDRGRVDALHPGRSAKKNVNCAAAQNLNGKDRKALGKLANKAYCEAMRGWQDDLYENVFEPAGLLRTGPRRARLTRSQYKEQKEMARRRAETQEALEHADQAEHLLNTEFRRLEDREREIVGRNDALEKQERRVAALTLSAREMERMAVERKMEFERALERGSEAIDAREIEYRPATNSEPEGLRDGPEAPTETIARKRLWDLIQPAYRTLTKVAKRYFAIAVAEKRSRRDRAQLTADAAALRRAQEERHEPISQVYHELAAGRSLPHTPESFPGTLLIDHQMDPKLVRVRLDEMPNLALREAALANQDAYLLSEGKGVPELREQLLVGLRVLFHIATERGFDIESGRHHPENAADPKEANRHRDQLPDPIRVKIVKRNTQRVR